MEKLDESLITSDVCVRCGHCCKWTSEMQSVHPVNGPEWLNVMAGQSDKTELIWYENEVVEHWSIRDNKTVHEERARFRIKFTCPKLEVDKEAGTKKCGIYNDRPKVCRDYNCFRTANQTKNRPQNWDLVSGIIKDVHGVDVHWDGELQTAKIPIKNITKYEKNS